jgi:hypothetical protein
VSAAGKSESFSTASCVDVMGTLLMILPPMANFENTLASPSRSPFACTFQSPTTYPAGFANVAPLISYLYA